MLAEIIGKILKYSKAVFKWSFSPFTIPWKLFFDYKSIHVFLHWSRKGPLNESLAVFFLYSNIRHTMKTEHIVSILDRF